jgi:hypothetical protein
VYRFSIRFFCIIFLAGVLSFSLPAFDWGLITDNGIVQEGTGSDSDDIRYQALLLPWLSSPVTDNGDFYISAAFNASFENKEWLIVPELFRTDFAWQFNNAVFRIGRMQYSDPTSIILSGLLDGFSAAFDSSAGIFNAGLWYTGLLYKRSANIGISPEDSADYYNPVSFNEFFDTYFASRRLAFALGWEHYGIKELVRLKVSLLGQADLNNRNVKYHSQYLALRSGIPVGEFFLLDFAGAVGFIQADGDFQTGLAGEFGIAYFLPTELQDRLRFSGVFSSGKTNNVFPFTPITTVSMGDVLKAKISGLSLLILDYTARIHRSFSFSLSSAYFVLTDLGTYNGYPGGKDGHFLGNEFYGKLIWSPVSDLQISIGGGLFIPAMGNADPRAEPRWKLELNATLAVF